MRGQTEPRSLGFGGFQDTAGCKGFTASVLKFWVKMLHLERSFNRDKLSWKLMVYLYFVLWIQTSEDPAPELGQSSSMTITSNTRDCVYIPGDHVYLLHCLLNNLDYMQKKIQQNMCITHASVMHREVGNHPEARQGWLVLDHTFVLMWCPSTEGVPLSQWTI